MAWRLGLGTTCALVVFLSSGRVKADDWCEVCSGHAPTVAEVSLMTPEVGLDEVLVLRLEEFHGRELSQQWWQHATVEVVGFAGLTIEGEIETEFGVFASWRPSSSWTPGDYEVRITVDRTFSDPDAFGESTGFCGSLHVTAPFEVVDENRHNDTEVAVSLEAEYRTLRSGLDDLVCCNGALPQDTHDDGGVTAYCAPISVRREVTGTSNYCTVRRKEGELVLRATLAFADESAGSQYAWRAFGGAIPADQEAFGSISSPTCLSFTIMDFATRETLTYESCHGFGIGEILGVHEVDPTEALEQNCDSAPYVCSGSRAWNRERCERWPDGSDYVPPLPEPDEEEKDNEEEEDDDDAQPASEDSPDAAGCSVGSSPWGPSGLLVVLFGLRRRLA